MFRSILRHASIGKYGLPLNVFGFLFLTFCCITFNFPTLNPVTVENMNYTSAAIGIVMLISLVTWLTTGRKRFTGPDRDHLLGVDRNEIVSTGETKVA